VTNEGGTDRHSRIVELESRRIILQVQRDYVMRSLDSPGTAAHLRQALIHRRDDLTRQLAHIDASLRLLRDESKS
jgi:hypothetical protein